MKSWLKGGLIGIVVGVIFLSLYFLITEVWHIGYSLPPGRLQCPNSECQAPWGKAIEEFFKTLATPFFFIPALASKLLSSTIFSYLYNKYWLIVPIILFAILTILEFFIIGALVGLIIEKARRRKK